MANQFQILIVDDNVSIAKTMSFILIRKGYTADIAYDGLEAVSMVKKKSYDLIFMDIKMPHIDGVETFKRIKKINLKAKVVMMTACSGDSLIQKAMEAGAQGVVYKPVDYRNVFRLIENSLGS